MPAKSHSRAVKLSATFLAKLAGVDTAASLFGIDRRTVRGWLGSVEVPEDHWSAIEATLLARGAEMTAKGETRGLVQTLTGAGIASRNRRYGQLIRERDARRQAATEAAQPAVSPTKAQADRLDDLRQRLLAQEISLTLQQHEAEGTEREQRDDDPERFLAELTEYVDYLLTLSDEEVKRRIEEVGDALQELHEQRVAKVREQTEAAHAAREVLTAQQAAEPSRPSRQPSQPSKPSVRVVDDYDHPSWQPIARIRLE